MHFSILFSYYPKIYFVFVIISFLLLPSVSHSQDQLYRSNEHKFRIKFPANWEILNGDGPNVIKKAVFNGNSIVIIVKELLTRENISVYKKNNPNLTTTQAKELIINEMDFDQWSDKEMMDYAIEMISELKNKFDDIKLLEKQVTHLDNEKCLYVKYIATYRIPGMKVKMKMIQYSVGHNGKLYQISASSEINRFNIYESYFLSSIRTFVFEDY